MSTPEPSETSQIGERRSIAVILCAGQGTRMGARQNKVFVPLFGKPMILYSIEAFQRSRQVHDILLVAHPREVAYCRSEIVERYHVDQAVAVIPGGATRHESEDSALTYLRPRIEGAVWPGVDVVLFHDGARPLVTPDEIDRLLEAARACGGALLGAPIEAHELIAEVGDDGMVADFLSVSGLWRAQTPQAFDAATLLGAYDQARSEGFLGTDTASTYERFGRAVHMVQGSWENIKMTTPHDIVVGEAILARRQARAQLDQR